MTWVEWLVLGAYGLLAAELVFLPISSEASTLQLFAPSNEARTVSDGNTLAAARERSPGAKLLMFALPTAICVLLFALPLACIFFAQVANSLSCRQSPSGNYLGAALIVIGHAVHLVATLQLRRSKRADAGPADGLFRYSRNPGLVGMFTFYVGICVVFGTWVLWAGLPVYLINMHVRVRFEEAHLEAKHGQSWRDYAAAVPRYLGLARRVAEPPPVGQEQVAAWFDETYLAKGFSYLRPARAYPIFVQLLGAQPGDRVLDVACGPGLLLRAALERGLEASGIDVSREAIAMANRHLPAADARHGNAEKLPFADGEFAGVTCLGSIERFLDREEALREMLRVSRPDARYCFLVRNASTLVWRYWREGLGKREVEGHQDARTIEQWRELFRRVGFEVESVLPDQWPRQRWRQLLPWWRPHPGREEPIGKPIVPLRWCNELIFVLRRAGATNGAP